MVAESVRSALQIVKANKPRDFCLYGSAIERNLNTHFVKPFTHKWKLTDFNCPPLIFTKTTLVYGPSNSGKTSFVLAHFKNPLFVSHMDTLKKLSPDHDAIVFDDMSFAHIPPDAIIHLVDFDNDRDIHVRYGTVHIPANTIKVFTHNTKEIFHSPSATADQNAAINRRVTYFHVPLPLYGALNLNPLPAQGIVQADPAAINRLLPGNEVMEIE